MDKHTEYFMKDGCFCKIEKDEQEPLEYYYERSNFIVSQKPQNEEEYKRYVIFSRIWINMKYLGSEYAPEILGVLSNMEKNMK